MNAEERDEADRLDREETEALKAELEAVLLDQDLPEEAHQRARQQLQSIETHELHRRIVQELASLLSEPARPTAESLGLFFDFLDREQIPLPPATVLIGSPVIIQKDDHGRPAMEAIQRNLVPMLEHVIARIVSGECHEGAHDFGYSRGRALAGSIADGDFEVGMSMSVSAEIRKPQS